MADTRIGRTAAKTPRRRRWVPVLIALTLVGVVSGGAVIRNARAQLDEGLFDLGAQMMRYEDANQDLPRQLILNGQVIHLSSGTVDQPMDRVLDTFETRCEAVDGGLEAQLEALREEHPDAREALGEPGSGLTIAGLRPVLRREQGGEGYVACLDVGSSIPVEEIGERIQRYQASGDISEVGEPRYVFAEEGRGRHAGTTHFVAMWVTGSFVVDDMFPEAGDAPGRDPRELDRPEGARRVLSGWERDVPHTVTVYDTASDSAELEAFYRRNFQRNGWSLLESPDHALPPGAPRSLIAEKGQRMVTVLFHLDARSGRTSAAVFEVR